MRIIFAGTPDVAVVSLEILIKAGCEIVAVLTREDVFVGRKKVLQGSPVADFAVECGIPVIKANRIDDDVISGLLKFEPDLICIVAYGVLVPEKALGVVPFGWINLHFSLLPKWRGAAPVQRAIMAGDLDTGVTVFQLEKGLDTGPYYAQQKYRIGGSETSGEALANLAEIGGNLLVEVVNDIGLGSVELTVQEDRLATFAPKIGTLDALLKWECSAAVLYAMIKGVTPFPGAWTTFRGQKIKILDVGLGFGCEDVQPGSIRVVSSGKNVNIYVGTGEGLLEIFVVQLAGKRFMAAANWANGYSPDGEFFV